MRSLTLTSLLLAVSQLAGSFALTFDRVKADRRALLSDDNDSGSHVGFALMPVMFVLGAALGAVATWMLMRRKLARHSTPSWHCPSCRHSSDDILVSKSIAIDLDSNVPVGLGVYDYSVPGPQASRISGLQIVDAPQAKTRLSEHHDKAQPSTRPSQGQEVDAAGGFTVTLQLSSDSDDNMCRNQDIPYELHTSGSFHTPPGSPNKEPISSKAPPSVQLFHAPTSSPPPAPPHKAIPLEDPPSLDTCENNIVVHSKPRGMPPPQAPVKGWSTSHPTQSMSRIDAARAALVAPHKLARSRTAALSMDGPHSAGAPSRRGVSEHHMSARLSMARSVTLNDEHLEAASANMK